MFPDAIGFATLTGVCGLGVLLYGFWLAVPGSSKTHGAARTAALCFLAALIMTYVESGMHASPVALVALTFFAGISK